MDSLQINEVYCRKLTVIAFLNDDYEGGKFYFAHSFHSRDYIDVTPGTVIVFPSFVPHGVEPVTSGKRISCATWLIGPNFK
jgi:predicted 2-oxoglutarate/Fe(II)-dependent dioxygenase YbiX